MHLVLASASPRRRELLAAAGLRFLTDPADTDESVRPGEPPEAYALRVARDKAAIVARRRPDHVVLAADTIVVVDDEILGKPGTAGEAASMLARLSGHTHEVLTAVVVRAGRTERAGVEATRVTMDALDEATITWYVGTGEPMDKAGAYAIQGLASRFVPRVEGSYSNVVGLPVTLACRLLAESGFDVRLASDATPGLR